jgi:hypothetical protein
VGFGPRLCFTLGIGACLGVTLLLFARLFFAHLVADRTANCGTSHAVPSGNVAGDAADHCAFQATGA